MTHPGSPAATGATRAAIAGTLIAAGLSLLCILIAAAYYAYEWVITDGHVADTGHPPLSGYLVLASLCFVPALSLLGLILALPARRGAAGRPFFRIAIGFHVVALLLAAAGWLWALAA